MDKAFLFHVRNKQSPGSGEPPSIDSNTPNHYHAYFENAQSEQLIFIYSRDADKGTLYHGDLGWDQPRPVVDGKCPGIILDDAETLWLRACWMAVTAFRQFNK